MSRQLTTAPSQSTSTRSTLSVNSNTRTPRFDYISQGVSISVHPTATDKIELFGAESHADTDVLLDKMVAELPPPDEELDLLVLSARFEAGIEELNADSGEKLRFHALGLEFCLHMQARHGLIYMHKMKKLTANSHAVEGDSNFPSRVPLKQFDEY
ncbi:hypothetical protein DFH09DRAFT_1076598 [Mycena vulgaris]|nr:hypothetical protein DFH09DRAFT_1076598 [Mycena vulgaris]